MRKVVCWLRACDDGGGDDRDRCRAAAAARRRRRSSRKGPDMNAYYQLGPDSQSHEGVPKGEVRGPFTLPSQAYPGTQHTYWVYVPAQYDPRGSRQPDDFSGWPGVQGHGRRPARAERARQPDLPPRDSGDALRVHQSRAGRRSSRSRHRATGAIATRTGRPNTTRSTIGTRASSSTS